MTFDKREQPFHITLLVSAFLLFPAAGRATQTKTALLPLSDSEKLVIVMNESQPLVFFPDRLPVEIEILSDANDIRPVEIEGTFRSALPLLRGDDYLRIGSWHRTGTSVFLDTYGEYYLLTNKGAVEILLLSPKKDRLENLIAFFDWYCRDTQIGVADVGMFGDPVVKKLFYSEAVPANICGESMALFNLLVTAIFHLPARQVNYYGLIEDGQKFWGHTVSEVQVDGRWIFFDSLFNVMASHDGRYLSMLETLELMTDHKPVTLRHNVAKDVIWAAGAPRPAHDYSFYYQSGRTLQHVHVSTFVTPPMREGVDYCYINSYYGFDKNTYISPEEFVEMFY